MAKSIDFIKEDESINRLYYDKAALNYESKGKIHQDGNRRRVEGILSDIIKDENIKVLDICSGTGLYLSILKGYVRNKNLHGLDISIEMVKRANRFSNNLVNASVYELPYRNNAFDLVTCSSALHHLSDLDKAISEIYRVLKPGGIFISDYDNNMHFAKANILMRRVKKAFLIYPIFLKIIGKWGKNNKYGLKGKKIEDISQEELHEVAESQNYMHDGIDGYQLKRRLLAAGLRKVEVFTYNSGSWNKGEKFGLLTSIFNNKIYSVSVKG